MAEGHSHRDTLHALGDKVKELAEANLPVQNVVDQVIDHMADALKRIFGG